MTIAERMDAAVDDVDRPDVLSEHWKVEDAGGADWALRKLRKARAELAEAEHLAEERIAAIRAFMDSERARLAPEIENWETRLALWHRSLLADDDGRKTVRLPSGTLTARKLPDSIEIEDPDALLLWAKDNATEYVRTKVELDRAEVKRAVLKGGEVIDGVKAVAGEIRFSVSTEVEEVEG